MRRAGHPTRLGCYRAESTHFSAACPAYGQTAVACWQFHRDARGNLGEVIHVSANPKYGSEKKGAPTNYYLTVAPSPIRVARPFAHCFSGLRSRRIQCCTLPGSVAAIN